jgi:hypothetical protein
MKDFNVKPLLAINIKKTKTMLIHKVVASIMIERFSLRMKPIGIVSSLSVWMGGCEMKLWI